MRNPGPSVAHNSAAKHSPDYQTCWDGTYAHWWDIDAKGVGTCQFCKQHHQFRDAFQTRWSHVQEGLRREIPHA